MSDEDDDYIEVDDDVRRAVDGLAVDCARSDYQHARERIQRLKWEWLAGGRKLHEQEVRTQAAEGALMMRKAPVYLRTLDGLLVPYEIDRVASGPPYPRDLILALRPGVSISIYDGAAPFAPVATRRYNWEGEYHCDGRPIYGEATP